ncbi:MAG: type II toxin-antitoxin system VapC family toxin [Gemmatimonadetes bacterium]|nr:type II toxin-antitoxin system VapC family toxin [Gemmatimonadota bacterium]
MRELLQTDDAVVVWWGTVVECASAFARQRKAQRLTPDQESEADAALRGLATRWTEVLASAEVRRQALRVVRVHGLRAPDALQLAAALVWAEGGDPADRQLVALDDRLREAARQEGFTIVPESTS